jgi:predicted MFS family arabinose efflux permease
MRTLPCVGAGRGYGAVLAERPVRRLLAASLGGRLAFSMLPLSLVLFGTAETGSTAAAGALIAAFSGTSIFAPARGRIVDRRGPPALVAFTLGCSGALLALVAAGAADAPTAVLVAVGAVAGLTVPPLGPFTRAVWGGALGARPERLRRAFALDSAGEETALVVAPLAVALIVAVAAPGAALVVAATGLLAGTTVAARSPLAGEIRRDAAALAGAGGGRMPPALWVAIAAFLGPGVALGAVNLAVPALARSAGAPARAGLLLAALGLGTATASLLTGRAGTRHAAWRPAAMQAALAAALAVAAAVSASPVAVALALAAGGAALGTLFVTLYVLVDELTPVGAHTRAFGWLVTANNGGIALGAVVAGEVVRADGGEAGLWLAAGSAAAGLPVALVLGLRRLRSDIRRPTSGPDP